MRELAQVSGSEHFAHFPSVFDKEECNAWVYEELSAFDPWFKDAQQTAAPPGHCQCLRLDNIFKSMFRLDFPQKEEINDLVFVLCRSIKFRVLALQTLCSNLHYCAYKQPTPNDRGFDVFYNLGYQMFPEARAELCLLQSPTTLKALETAFMQAIQFYKDESNMFRTAFLDGLLGYLNVLFSNTHDHSPQAYLPLFKMCIRVFQAADILFLYPSQSGAKYAN